MGTLSVPVSPWPAGFQRIPADAWTAAPIDAFAAAYDRLGGQGWYANLAPTATAVASWLDAGGLVVDYSGGTGLLADRAFAQRPRAPGGLLNVDASAKFLRLAAEKARDDPRLAVRLLPITAGRVATLAEAAPSLVGQIHGIACANAIHLYPDLGATARSWAAALRPGGRLHVQSGNLGPPREGLWIIDDTVRAVDAAVRKAVAAGAGTPEDRAALADPDRMAAYARVQSRYFPPAPTVERVLAALTAAGFEVGEVKERPIAVESAEWAAFLSVYHEGILPWIGGTRDVDGAAATEAAAQRRRDWIAQELPAAVGGTRFQAAWTYIEAVRA